MSDLLKLQLFVPARRFAGSLAERVVDTFLDSGYGVEDGRRGGPLAAEADSRGTLSQRTIADAMSSLQHVGQWSSTFSRRSSLGTDPWADNPTAASASVRLYLELDRPGDFAAADLDQITLSMSAVPNRERFSTVAWHFLAWARFLVDTLRPIYGRAGPSIDLTELQPFSAQAAAGGALPGVHWFNAFGPGLISQIGAARLATAPVWRVDLSVSGAIMVTLAPHPYDVADSTVGEVADYLGLSRPPWLTS